MGIASIHLRHSSRRSSFRSSGSLGGGGVFFRRPEYQEQAESEHCAPNVVEDVSDDDAQHDFEAIHESLRGPGGGATCECQFIKAAAVAIRRCLFFSGSNSVCFALPARNAMSQNQSSSLFCSS